MQLLQVEFNENIKLWGTRKQIKKAVKVLDELDLSQLSEGEARLKIQRAIDEHRLKADILYKGNTVWNYSRIIRNLKRIIKHGRLFGKKRVRWIPLGSMLYMPATPQDFKPILSQYFYQFLSLECGSIAHYNRAGWIAHYPYVEDLKKFFKKNEFGKPVKEDIPGWYTDAKRIVEQIERLLFPFEAYLKHRQKS